MAQNETTVYLIRQRTTENEFSIDASDLVLMDHGTGSKRHRAFTVQEFIDFVKAGKLDGMTIGTAGIRKSSGQPVITGFATISGGTVEALTKFMVGNSEWNPGNNQPYITGLFALEAGQVDASSKVTTDCIDSHTANTNIEVKQKLIKDSTDATQKLDLGPTKVNGALSVTDDAAVTGDLEVYGNATVTGTVLADNGFSTNADVTASNGTVTAGKLKLVDGKSVFVADTQHHDESDIVTSLRSLASGTVAVIINKHSAALQFDSTRSGTFFPLGTWQIPANGSAMVIVHGTGENKKGYPMVPEFT